MKGLSQPANVLSWKWAQFGCRGPPVPELMSTRSIRKPFQLMPVLLIIRGSNKALSSASVAPAPKAKSVTKEIDRLHIGEIYREGNFSPSTAAFVVVLKLLTEAEEICLVG